jgi:RNA binding S1 domain protein
MPDLDVTIRGAVSIARRIQDPLAEAVKIDPQSIGVGQYQHDVNQKALNAALDAVVESVVNYVGVDLNTASAALLQHISGLTAATAGNIVAYRREKGPFKNRQELLAVNRLGPATFTQCAGFLRIAGGTEPLDNTSVHPESYELAGQIIEHYGYCEDDIRDPQLLQELQNRLQMNAAPGLAAELGTSEQSIRDILEELRKTGRDARSEFPQPLTRQHVVSLDELQAGALVQGTVQNVVDFGAFVDFGLKIPGLVHRSELSTHPFHHPMDIVHVGDIVTCVILSVDAPRKRIALSMKRVQQHKR